jgi:hypothetical protein
LIPRKPAPPVTSHRISRRVPHGDDDRCLTDGD